MHLHLGYMYNMYITPEISSHCMAGNYCGVIIFIIFVIDLADSKISIHKINASTTIHMIVHACVLTASGMVKLSQPKKLFSVLAMK